MIRPANLTAHPRDRLEEAFVPPLIQPPSSPKTSPPANLTAHHSDRLEEPVVLRQSSPRPAQLPPVITKDLT